MLHVKLRRTFSTGFLTLAAVILVTSGCTDAGKGPKTVSASGTVTYQGKGVADANVAFLGDGNIQAARAITDSNGEFILSTTSPGDGAVAGVHKVTVTKMMSAPKKGAADPKAGSMEAAVQDFKANQNKEAPKSLSMIPEKYSQATSSPLQFTVEEGKPNNFKIELTD